MSRYCYKHMHPTPCRECSTIKVMVIGSPSSIREALEREKDEARAEVERLRTKLCDVETIPLSSWAEELAAARENVAGIAALLRESQTDNERLREALKSSREAVRACRNVILGVSSWEAGAADALLDTIVGADAAFGNGGGTQPKTWHANVCADKGVRLAYLHESAEEADKAAQRSVVPTTRMVLVGGA